jgi:hypothetical protein
MSEQVSTGAKQVGQLSRLPAKESRTKVTSLATESRRVTSVEGEHSTKKGGHVYTLSRGVMQGGHVCEEKPQPSRGHKRRVQVMKHGDCISTACVKGYSKYSRLVPPSIQELW